ncbi:HAD-IA family hydrolase [Actinomyces israelii]|uniref:HAD-IA family hydrolase n=1 Tax=Actinomyces israelii TaxID=1659 RepID=A0ABT4IAP5_9ACTO|nr:HAD-IA family hydrolase [Actinomyces israelii]MCZ0858823.1 HAD-IA family hydrolase [Actinomyces israelii]WKR20787.1 Phosphoglycolate phosphatase [Actinomyces israelii]
MSTDAASEPPPAPPLPPSGTTAVRAVLLDADGVLQLIGTPWYRALSAGGGEPFAKALLSREGPALSGRESLRNLLERLVVELDLARGADELMALWRQATPDPPAWQLVRELRAAGYLTVLATNQHEERREWMRTALGYDGLCDVDAYSCLLGAAKPDPDYFRAALAMAGVSTGEALFVDDSAENIAAAAALGLRTLHHPTDAGGRVLRRGVVEALSA